MSRYIDADKLKEHASHYVRTQPHFHYGDWDNMCISGKEVDEIIDTCTAADVVEVRHGEWIWDFNLEGDDFFRCSVCGRQEVINGLCGERNPIEEFPYCHCGAKMDGERREG